MQPNGPRNIDHLAPVASDHAGIPGERIIATDGSTVVIEREPRSDGSAGLVERFTDENGSTKLEYSIAPDGSVQVQSITHNNGSTVVIEQETRSDGSTGLVERYTDENGSTKTLEYSVAPDGSVKVESITHNDGSTIVIEQETPAEGKIYTERELLEGKLALKPEKNERIQDLLNRSELSRIIDSIKAQLESTRKSRPPEAQLADILMRNDDFSYGAKRDRATALMKAALEKGPKELGKLVDAINAKLKEKGSSIRLELDCKQEQQEMPAEEPSGLLERRITTNVGSIAVKNRFGEVEDNVKITSSPTKVEYPSWKFQDGQLKKVWSVLNDWTVRRHSKK